MPSLKWLADLCDGYVCCITAMLTGEGRVDTRTFGIFYVFKPELALIVTSPDTPTLFAADLQIDTKGLRKLSYSIEDLLKNLPLRIFGFDWIAAD